MMLYHLFGLLWTNQFIVGFGLMVVAGAIANFYWTAGDTNLMPAAPVMGSVRRTARYHLGSIALGSFLVAVIQFIRLVLEYIDRKTKNMQEANPIYKYLMCIVKCCMVREIKYEGSQLFTESCRLFTESCRSFTESC
jgi:choline transporter-like protein 2/4/5